MDLDRAHSVGAIIQCVLCAAIYSIPQSTCTHTVAILVMRRGDTNTNLNSQMAARRHRAGTADADGAKSEMTLDDNKPAFRIDKAAYDAWAKDTIIYYAITSVPHGRFYGFIEQKLSFGACLGGGFKVTLGTRILYEGFEFEEAQKAFNNAIT